MSDLFTLVNGHTLKGTPFLNDVAHLARRAEKAIRNLRLNVHAPGEPFSAALGNNTAPDDAKYLERMVESYLRGTMTEREKEAMKDLRPDATTIAIGMNKSMLKGQVDGWEEYYQKMHIAEWMIGRIHEGHTALDTAYTGAVHLVGSEPTLTDRQAAAFRSNMAGLFENIEESYLSMMRGAWREIYDALKIREDPERMVSLAARAAVERRRWDEKRGDVLEKELQLDGVSVPLFEYLTERDVTQEKHEQERERQEATRKEEEARRREENSAKIARGVRPQTPSLDAAVDTELVRVGQGIPMQWMEAMEMVRSRTDGEYQLPTVRELIERRQNMLQAATVWSREVWELQNRDGIYRLMVLEDPMFDQTTQRFVARNGVMTHDYPISPAFVQAFKLSQRVNQLQATIDIPNLQFYLPELYRYLFGDRIPPELSPEDRQMTVTLPIVGQQAPMKLSHNMTGRPTRTYMIEPCRHNIEVTGTAYAICRQAPRDRGQGVDLSAQLYDDDPPAGQRQQTSAVTVDPENLGAAIDAAERGETVRGTIIEPAGVQPVVFENLTIYHPETCQPFRTYRRVVLDSKISDIARTQDSWIEQYAETPRQLPSFPLLYAMIEDLVRSGNPAKEGLLADLRAYWIATSTQPDYGRRVMIHDAGREPFELPCPFPEKSGLARDLNEDGQQTLRALLMSRDLASALQTLQTFSSVPPYLWVPDQKGRQDYPLGAVFAYVDHDRFILSCNVHPANCGRSRGVAIEDVTEHTS